MSTTHLIKNRHICQPWIPSLLCYVTLFLWWFVIYFSIYLNSLELTSGNLKAKAQQIINGEIVVPLSTPINKNTTVAEVEMELQTIRHDAVVSIFELTLFTIILPALFLLKCAVDGTCLVTFI